MPNIYQSPVARAVPFDNQTNGFVALNTQTAIEESILIAYLGSGSDGDVSLSSGTTTLTRTMYYNNLTLSGTAVVDTNGYKIFVKNTLSLLDNSSITHNGNNGGNASGNTAGTAGTANTGVEVGSGQAGTIGATQNNDSTTPTTQIGYGGNGATGGTGGGNATGMGTGGVVTYVPEQTLNMWHYSAAGVFKSGGGGGSGGNGGNPSALATAGAGGGGGSGGGVVMIFARTFGSSSTIGLRTLGGNGGTGGNAVNGNSGGGGGGAGGGGGFIYVIAVDLVLGNISVAGGTGGTGGTQTGSGTAGGAGQNGSVGHYSAYSSRTGTWTVT